MASAEDIFTQLLKAHHQSRTKARRVVFEALNGSTQPLTMRQLVTQCIGVDRASVYRAVELFERLSIAQRVYTGWKYRLELSDRFTAHHHHLTCTECGQAMAINEDELEQFIDTVALRHGFAATAHQIEIQGCCANCSATSAPND